MCIITKMYKIDENILTNQQKGRIFCVSPYILNEVTHIKFGNGDSFWMKLRIGNLEMEIHK